MGMGDIHSMDLQRARLLVALEEAGFARSKVIRSTNTRWLKKLAALVTNVSQCWRLIVHAFTRA
jgi:hypothetical protein